MNCYGLLLMKQKIKTLTAGLPCNVMLMLSIARYSVN
ncbi:hypothetical protein PSYMO_05343 [Pseudomonas amygdali pv. mori str. 301020]|uniref:Uncharacterized protein n=1 Tax=Pseudomonas amygdali pv. mori str. 301020 TaxID=629261 RepID=A0A656G4L6_PSEA0|nr:hypothetical protein PSYMO_05343 [Pseudomonas amygdali pv. mori str. 301020]